MSEFMDGMTGTLWGELLILVVSLAAVAIAARIVALIWRAVFLRIASRTRTKIDQMLFEATEKPAYHAILVLGFYLAFQRLRLVPEIAGTRFFQAVEDAFFVAGVAVVARLVYVAARTLIDWYLAQAAGRTDTPLDRVFIPLLSRILEVVIFFIALTTILEHFGVSIAAFLATAGVASLALAFAAQETLANMIAGFTIMLDRPFRIGDRIELTTGEIGDVYEIGLRSTKILSFDNNVIVIPNKDIAGAKVINHSYPTEVACVRPKVGVAYGSDLVKVKQVILEICQSHPKVLSDPPPRVFFTEFGDSSLNLLAICSVGDYRDRFATLDEINMEIKRRFEEEGIEIPFPQRDLHIRSGLADALKGAGPKAHRDS